MPPADADVIIAGAGPAGCAAAIRLGKDGYRVLLIDRARFPRDKPCGDYCDPGAVAVLDELGILPSVRQAGAVSIPGMRIVAQDGTEIHPPFPAGHGLLIRRLALDADLAGAAAQAGAEVTEQTRVLDVHVTADRVSVETDRGALTAALVIVADGMHSTIGHRRGFLAPIPPRRYTIGAYFSGVGGPPRGELHLGPGVYCGVARFGEGLANVCMALSRAHLRHRTADAAFTAALPLFPRLADELSGALRDSRYRSAGPIGFRSNRVCGDRLLVAGDAAAQVDPMTGQGMYFALRSGILAAETAAGALAAGDLSATRLAAYAARRRAVFAPKVRVARALQSLALHSRVTPLFVRRLRARPSVAQTLIGVTGDIVPPGGVVNLSELWRFVQGHDAHGA